jgi:hypothetical protein
MNLPVSYVILKLGGPPETILHVAIFFSVCCLGARLYMLRTNIQMNIWNFIIKVIFNVLIVSFLAAVVPMVLSAVVRESMLSFVAISLMSFLCSVVVILYVGCKKEERQFVYAKVGQMKKKLHR